MGISRVKINNYKSIKKLDICLGQKGINCILGKNGAGKTTIIKAIEYFYKVANNCYDIEDVIDKRNPYVQKTTIEISFDFTNLDIKSKNEYIENLMQQIDQYKKDNIISIRFTQHMNGEIEWYPITDIYKIRKVLKIFPLFVVNTRDISLSDWSELWDVVSDIAISGLKKDKESIQNSLVSAFSDIYGDKYHKVLTIIKQIFNEEKISLNEYDYKKRFKNALLSNLGGEIFEYDEQNVSYYSTGINTLKFVTLFVKLICELAETAWKDVLMVVDEPEISLHPQFIEDLAEVIVEGDGIEFLISTHSAHFVSSLIKGNCSIRYNQVYIENGYTQIRQIEDIVSEKEKYLISDNEAISFFANGLLFVEGPTEIQVLQNRYLANLYPELKKITIYNTQSNDSATRLIIPKATKPAIPYRVLLDMDKVLRFDKKKKKFKRKDSNQSVNPLGNKEILKREKYYFYSKKD